MKNVFSMATEDTKKARTIAIYRTLVENVTIGISLLSPKMEVLAVNKQMCEWFPNIKATKTIVCHRDFKPSPAADVCEYCPTRETLIDGQTHEAIVDFPSNADEIRSFKITSSPVKNARNEITAVIEMFMDYSETKRLEKFSENEISLRKAIEKNEDNFLVVDKNGVVLFTNPITEKLFGSEPGGLRGSVFGYPLGYDQSTEIEILNRLTGIRYAELGMVDIEWDRNPATLVLVRDVTDLKKAKQVALELAEQKRIDEIKSEFISTVSHELRTPMAIMQECVSQVLDGLHGETTPPQREMLSMTIENIGRLSRIVDNLLDISKIEAGRIQLKIELTDIVGLFKKVSSSFEAIARDKGLDFKKTFPQEKITIYIDKDKITQVLVNLLSNAVKFTNKGHIELWLGENNGIVECTVSDTGRGIAEEDIPKVFAKFEQFGRVEGAGEKGTGLGLAISKQLVELHKGKIWVDSKPGKGSKFGFALPKLSAQDMIREHVGLGLKKALVKGVPFSIIAFEIKNYGHLQQKLGAEKTGSHLDRLEQILKTNLRRQDDKVFKGVRAVIVMLPQTLKTNALAVLERNRIFIDKAVCGGIFDKDMEIISRVAGFPEDADTEEGLLVAVGM